ncbi:MAG: GTPase Era [Eubacteriaceae bacterium]|nr:GTPase Era [Eubacteriaceae bacterium]
MAQTSYRSGFVALIGRPNVGKSTLINQIMEEKIVITSAKPQTTRNSIRCIRSDDNSQMVFIDTPGVHKPKNKLGEYMKRTIRTTLEDVDAVLYLVEPEAEIGAGDAYILKVLAKVTTPVILLINKTDTIEKTALLEVMATYGEYDFIKAIVPISAKTGDGVDELLDLIKDNLPEGPQYFPDDMIVDQSERFIVAELIREKALDHLRDEVPHGIAVEVNAMKTRAAKDLVDIEATIFCERESHKGIVIGKKGAMLKRIGSDARADIEFFLKQPVNLQLWVKVRAGWREKVYDLKDLGYDA